MSEPQSTGTSPPTPPDAGAPAKGDELEFLRADFGHVAESLLANEELGEKRVTFFTTLVCAVLGGIGFLTTELKNVVPVSAYVAFSLALLLLLVLGVISMLRIRRRNDVTDQYKAILKMMREAGAPSLSAEYRHVFSRAKSSNAKGERDSTKRTWLNGGHALVLLVLNVALLAAFGWSTVLAALHWKATPLPQPTGTKCCSCEK